MFKSIAVCMALMLMAPGLTQARPFTAKDLALLDRVSDPCISPDARFVAYNLRSTDWDGNHGVNALWVIDRSAANSAPRLVRDQEKSSTSPRWSADGQWLYVADWSVPMLVAHSGRDDRVPLDQGMGAYGAAQLRHIPSQLLYFPDENHWVLKPQNSVQWYATVEAWLKRWLGS
jgi:dipeptidyl aminopeptidase/acylaminoacyl peptidase